VCLVARLRSRLASRLISRLVLWLAARFISRLDLRLAASLRFATPLRLATLLRLAMLPFGSIPTRSPFPGAVPGLLPVRARVILPYDVVTLINFAGCTPVIVVSISHRRCALSVRRDDTIA